MKFRIKSYISILFILIFIFFIINLISSDNIFNKNELKLTLEHPFYIDGKWIKAENLKVGDELFTVDGKKVRITNITDVVKDNPVSVYNIEDRYYHNFILFDGLVVHNSNNNFLIDNSRVDYYFKSLDSTNTKVAYGSKQISEDNLGKIFSNEMSSGQKVAKGIVYVDSDGNYNIRFWSTGEGDFGNNIHHRDVLANLMSEEAYNLENRAFRLDNEQYLEKAGDLIKTAKEITTLRTQATIPDVILANSEGFQFSLGPDGKVMYLDVDSAITSTQISRGNVISSKSLSKMITMVHESIAPELRGYTEVRIKGLSKMKLDGELVLPDNLKVAELF